MAFTVTPASRRIAMAALLGLATAGALIRYYAPAPSTLRDVGTLLMVLWLPAVGNLIGYFARKLPRSAQRKTDFAPDAPFTPHLQVRLEAVTVPAQASADLDHQTALCTLIVGRRGFTARMARPVLEGLAGPQELELLLPVAALPMLVPGTEFHLLVGRTAVAKGWVDAGSGPA